VVACRGAGNKGSELAPKIQQQWEYRAGAVQRLGLGLIAEIPNPPPDPNGAWGASEE
jgi:hypothetical protein